MFRRRRFRLGGGGARSKLWRQIQADIYGKRVETVEGEEGAAYGARDPGGRRRPKRGRSLTQPARRWCGFAAKRQPDPTTRG